MSVPRYIPYAIWLDEVTEHYHMLYWVRERRGCTAVFDLPKGNTAIVNIGPRLKREVVHEFVEKVENVTCITKVTFIPCY